MTRRNLIQALAISVMPASAQPQAPQVIHYREYARCLPDYLRMLAAEAVKHRDAEIAKAATPELLRARQQWARETFWRLIGGSLEKTPLHVRVTGGFARKRYRVENLVYESQPGFFIPANLYIPTTAKPPFPGVLFQMGHSPNGKAADTYQRCCQSLAQLGYLVLAFDPMGQGERINYPGANGQTRLASTDDEHTVPGRQMLLVGETATRMQVWDAVRSLDVLASYPLVDPKRIASAGQSGGGTLTMMLAAVDDRLHAAAVCSGNTENVACPNFLPPGSTDDAEQDLVASGPAGFDRWDLLWPFAPKPLLILVSAKDFFGTYSANYQTNGLYEYQRLQSAYRLLGQPDRIRRVESPLPHGLSYSSRVEVYRWFERWLKTDGQNIREEPPVSPEPDRNLWATATGGVNRDLKSKTPFQLVESRAAQIKTPTIPADLRRVLALDPTPTRPEVAILGRVQSRNCEILAVETPTAPHVWCPAWIFAPHQTPQRHLLMFGPRGRNARWHETELDQQLAARRIAVCAADVRGIGDLQPEFSSGAPGYVREHQDEENYAWGSLIFGRPLLSQRVSDILGLIDALCAHWNIRKGTGMLLAAKGKMTVPALCAAALDPRIAALYLSGHLVSWRNIVETENYTHPLANFVPNVLRHTDLPNLARSLAPRKITLAGAVDAAGKPIPIERVQEIYASPNIETRTEEAWDIDSLSRL